MYIFESRGQTRKSMEAPGIASLWTQQWRVRHPVSNKGKGMNWHWRWSFDLILHPGNDTHTCALTHTNIHKPISHTHKKSAQLSDDLILVNNFTTRIDMKRKYKLVRPARTFRNQHYHETIPVTSSRQILDHMLNIKY